ncbi:MAG: segregation/condensation protein A [Pseudomonadota bacterium]
MSVDPEQAEIPVHPAQQEMPFAVVQGVPVTEPPKDLYIPPDALAIFLEAFEGPLDLLLYLIRRQNLDILDIPVARITEQYMSYIDMMREMRFELAAEYLLMAAMLAEIKSRMLLPRPALEDDEEEDPRAELVRRLQEYERYKKAAEDIEELPRMEREWFDVVVEFEPPSTVEQHPDVTMDAILKAFRDVLQRAEMFADHQVQRELLSVRERMSTVLELARHEEYLPFGRFFEVKEGRAGAVVTLVALLELLKEALIEIVQSGEREPIYVKLAA